MNGSTTTSSPAGVKAAVHDGCCLGELGQLRDLTCFLRGVRGTPVYTSDNSSSTQPSWRVSDAGVIHRPPSVLQPPRDLARLPRRRPAPSRGHTRHWILLIQPEEHPLRSQSQGQVAHENHTDLCDPLHCEHKYFSCLPPNTRTSVAQTLIQVKVKVDLQLPSL